MASYFYPINIRTISERHVQWPGRVLSIIYNASIGSKMQKCCDLWVSPIHHRSMKGSVPARIATIRITATLKEENGRRRDVCMAKYHWYMQR